MLYEENIHYFRNKDGSLLQGFLHTPLNNIKNIGIIYCPPFAEEENCSHAVIVQAARRFTETGYHVFRFYYSGTGDSEGVFSQSTLTVWKDDILQAINFFKSKTGIDKIALWGLRLGSDLMLCTCDESKPEFALIWQPILDFKSYIHNFLRLYFGTQIIVDSSVKFSSEELIKQLKKHGKLEIGGYQLSEELYKSFKEQKNFWEIDNSKTTFPLYIFTISMNQNPPFKIRHFLSSLVLKTSQYQHIEDTPFWDRYWIWKSEKIVQNTISWINSQV